MLNALTLLVCLNPLAQDQTLTTEQWAARFARLALDCVHQEYPNKIAHVMASDADALPPRKLHPVFYGCFDWHSSVHGHWLLVRLLRSYPKLEMAAEMERALDQSFTAERVAGELDYFNTGKRAAYERPYGLAWYLQLTAELRQWQDPRAARWLETLKPLEAVVAERISSWLPKLAYPIRTGEHSQTAFAFGLILDWARTAEDQAMIQLLVDKAKSFHLKDRGCNLGFEPSGQDFLSPCLAEADFMRRVLSPSEFSAWLTDFLPAIPTTAGTDWLPLAVVTDAADGKLAHLDGLNLSRAWMLEGIAAALPQQDPRRGVLSQAAEHHRKAGLAAVTGQHYEGGHWLGSFATYLVTKRGL